MGASSPLELAEVTAGHLIEALALLAHPTVFYHPDRDTVDEQDVPQLCGALAAAIERVAVARGALVAPDAARAWAAGWLQTSHAGRGPCGDRQAFDLVAVRLGSTVRLLEGYDTGDNPGLELVKACVAAAASFAAAAMAASRVTDPDGAVPDPEQALSLTAERMRAGAESLTSATFRYHQLVEIGAAGGDQ